MQLDMFKQTALRKPAVVIAFPVDRRATMVRSTARELAERDYVTGRAFWKGHVKALRAQLSAIGIPPRQIDQEVRRYSVAVGRAMILFRQYHGPDSAA